MFSFFSSDKPPYAVQKIKNGEYLDKAQLATITSFFSSWMQKKPRKAMVGTWFVLHENEQFVYWGIPKFKRLFSDTTIVDEFYKTARKELDQKFPNYQKITGNVVRLKLQDLIRESNDLYYTVSVPSGSFGAKLEAKHINIQTKCSIKIKSTNEEQEEIDAKFEVVLDKNNLDLVRIKKIENYV